MSELTFGVMSFGVMSFGVMSFGVMSFGVTSFGVLLLLVSAFGLFRLPDALSRQHAATKSAVFALSIILLGVGLEANDLRWWWRIIAIITLLLVTLPVASHMLARAAARHAYTLEELRAVRKVRAAQRTDG